jgi:hypothetical protein
MLKEQFYTIQIGCDRCTLVDKFTAPTRQGCISYARRQGWEFRMTEHVCKGCAQEETPN